jgi:hypothetical protein
LRPWSVSGFFVAWIGKLWCESWNCGVNRRIVAWIVKLWRESLICWRVSWYCGVISLFVREWPLSATVITYNNLISQIYSVRCAHTVIGVRHTNRHKFFEFSTSTNIFKVFIVNHLFISNSLIICYLYLFDSDI